MPPKYNDRWYPGKAPKVTGPVAPEHIKSLSLKTKVAEDGDWWYGPSQHDMENFEIVQQTYRSMTEKFIATVPKISKLAKKRLFTISCNVLMALDKTASEDFSDRSRDLYKPLEISVSKWSIEEGIIDNKHFMINPGDFDSQDSRFSHGCAAEHAALHKIDITILNEVDNPVYTNDYKNVFTTIYDFIGPDRTVFSCSLKHVRQDIGSLKWLLHKIRQDQPTCDQKYKPIKVYSLWDLFIVLSRKYAGAAGVGKGVAERVLNSSIYEELSQENMCEEHQGDYESQYCALAQSTIKSKNVFERIRVLKERNSDAKDDESPPPNNNKMSASGDTKELT